MSTRFQKKYEEQGELPFVGLDKGIVIQETKAFSETPLNIRRCCVLLTKILYLILQGDHFSKNDVTNVFFAITKLFQCKNLFLRRLVFLTLKEISVLDDSAIIIFSSLTKDMSSDIEMYRSHSIRVLCKILTDLSLLGQGERYLKQAIVDKDAVVQSAALVSGVHLMNHPANFELVKRWFTEIFVASKSRHEMVQYHALGLMFQLRKYDQMAIIKLLGSVQKHLTFPFAKCLLVRLITHLLKTSPSADHSSFFDYLSSCLRGSNDLVMYEAARAVTTNNIPGLPQKLVIEAIAALRSLLSHPKSSLRFAGIRTLNEISLRYPKEVQVCNHDIEPLFNDPKRNIATLAVTILLKTGGVESVDHLMKEILKVMRELTDEFKIILVEALQTLCAKFPQKYQTLIALLSEILQNPGGFPYKKAIVDAFFCIIKNVPESRGSVLSSLCEFIEDCEFVQLSVIVLDLVGREGPFTPHPFQYIRYIYNRVILDNQCIRSAAVQALANFGIQLVNIRPSIKLLLRRMGNDNDDEVRDQATFYLSILEQDTPVNMKFFFEDIKIQPIELEKSLLDYQHSSFEAPFDIDAAMTRYPVRGPQEASPNAGGPSFPFLQETPSSTSVLSTIPEFGDYGKVFKSSDSIKLSEDETEYPVSCIKHLFEKHIVFEFLILNTVYEQELENVGVKMEYDAASEDGLNSLLPDVEVEIKNLRYDCPASCFISFNRNPTLFNVGTFTVSLRYTVFSLDSSGFREDDGEEDEYPLENLYLVLGDYCLKALVPDFQDEWEKSENFEAVETFTLINIKTLQKAVNEILSHFSLQAIDATDEVPARKSKHILFASGIWISQVLLYVRARMRINPNSQNIDIELTVRSSNHEINQLLASSI